MESFDTEITSAFRRESTFSTAFSTILLKPSGESSYLRFRVTDKRKAKIGQRRKTIYQTVHQILAFPLCQFFTLLSFYRDNPYNQWSIICLLLTLIFVRDFFSQFCNSCSWSTSKIIRFIKQFLFRQEQKV